MDTKRQQLLGYRTPLPLPAAAAKFGLVENFGVCFQKWMIYHPSTYWLCGTVVFFQAFVDGNAWLMYSWSDETCSITISRHRSWYFIPAISHLCLASDISLFIWFDSFFSSFPWRFFCPCSRRRRQLPETETRDCNWHQRLPASAKLSPPSRVSERVPCFDRWAKPELSFFTSSSSDRVLKWTYSRG